VSRSTRVAAPVAPSPVKAAVFTVPFVLPERLSRPAVIDERSPARLPASRGVTVSCRVIEPVE